jgi:hypothetical protein
MQEMLETPSQVSNAHANYYSIASEDHPALALQERTGHLGDFAGLD